MALHAKSILHFPAIHPTPLQKKKSQQIFCVPTGAGGSRVGSSGSAEDAFALRPWGRVLGIIFFYSAVSGRAAGRHVPAWVSVGLCILSSLLLLLLLPWAPQCTPQQVPGPVLCSVALVVNHLCLHRVWFIIIFFFFAWKPQVLGLQPFHRARLQRDPAKHAERPFAHPSYRIRPIISTIASYDFFIYINII